MENKLELFNKEYADRFIRENYERLAEVVCISKDKLPRDRKRTDMICFMTVFCLYMNRILYLMIIAHPRSGR